MLKKILIFSFFLFLGIVPLTFSQDTQAVDSGRSQMKNLSRESIQNLPSGTLQNLTPGELKNLPPGVLKDLPPDVRRQLPAGAAEKPSRGSEYNHTAEGPEAKNKSASSAEKNKSAASTEKEQTKKPADKKEPVASTEKRQSEKLAEKKQTEKPAEKEESASTTESIDLIESLIENDEINSLEELPGAMNAQQGGAEKTGESKTETEDQSTELNQEQLEEKSGTSQRGSIIENQYRHGYSSSLAGNLHQFGYDIFSSASVKPSSQAVPGKKYILGTGDYLLIRVWGGSMDYEYPVTVDREGVISIPKIGPIPVAGVEYGDIESVVRKEAEKYVQGINISIVLTQLRSLEIYVVGAVRNPGLHMVPAFSTIFDGLMYARGIKKTGSLRDVKLYRNNKKIQSFDLYDLLLHGNRTSDRILQNKDVIFVSEIGKTVAVAGAVNNPAIFEIISKKSLKEIAELAGGLLPQAFGERIYLRRFDKNREFVVQDINMAENPDAWNRIKVKDGDLLELDFMGSSQPYVVRVSGNVSKPEMFSYRPGMKLSDVLKSPDVLMPGTLTEFALLFRYNNETTRTTPMRFPLSEVFTGEYDAALAPYDEIVILSRAKIGIKENITIKGAVWKPGQYKFEPGLKLDDALAIAGGIKDGARTDQIEVTRQVKTEDKFETEYITLNLDKDSKFVLQPDDSVKVPLRRDYTVSLKGHIKQPRRVKYHNGMKLSDILISEELPQPEDILKPDAVMEFGLISRYDRQTTRREVFRFPLSKAFSGKYDVDLQPFDKIIILSRKNFDIKEKLHIRGAVWKIGDYNYYPGLKLEDAVALAGGFKFGARTDKIEITRQVKREDKFETEYITLNFNQDKAFELKPNDTVRIPLRREYTVSLEGHVKHPKTVKYHTGMKLSDILISEELPQPEDILKPDAVMEFGLISRYDRQTTRKKVIRFPLSQVFSGEYDVDLHPFDKIMVFSRQGFGIKEKIQINGAVWKAGEIDYSPGLKLKDAVALAGGFKFGARTDKIEITRQVKREDKFETEYITLNFNQDKAFELKPNDTVRISLRREYTVSLEGHIKHPKTVKYHTGMKLSDILISEELSLPEDILKPDAIMKFGLISRYDRQTTRIKTFRFPLSKVFSGEYDLELYPFDKIIVFSRKDFGIHEKIYINGAVWKTGDFDYSPGLRLKDVLALAGGFKFGARTDHIEISRQTISDDRVKTASFLLDSSKNEDFPIQPYDSILVPRVKNASLVKKVSLSGEVLYPGTYTLREDEKVSDLIKRAGGFTENVYLYGAKFTSVKAREIQQKSIDKMLDKLRINFYQVSSETAQSDKKVDPAAQESLRSLISELESVRAEGRISIRVSDMESFRDSQYDFKLKDGDTLDIPSRPSFVSVVGSVYSPGSFLYHPDKKIDFYLDKSGGPSVTSDEDHMYLLKANGEIVSAKHKTGIFTTLYHTDILPGDTLVVPEDLDRIPSLQLIREISDIVFKIATTAGVALSL